VTALKLVVDTLTIPEAETITGRIRAWVRECPIDDIKRAYFGRVWLAMGYESWSEWCECELDGFKLPAVERRETVAELAESGMSNRAIADVTRVSEGTVRNDRKSGAQDYAPVIGLDGRTYPPKPVAEPDEEPVQQSALTKHFKAALRLLDYDAEYTAMAIRSPLYCDPYVHADDLDDLIAWVSIVHDGIRSKSNTGTQKGAGTERLGATRYSKDIQKLSASIAENCPALTDGEIAEALGAAQFLYELLRGETTLRENQ
jgi:hypothetical protein